jgi:hypothetical protein
MVMVMVMVANMMVDDYGDGGWWAPFSENPYDMGHGGWCMVMVDGHGEHGDGHGYGDGVN